MKHNPHNLRLTPIQSHVLRTLQEYGEDSPRTILEHSVASMQNESEVRAWCDALLAMLANDLIHAFKRKRAFPGSAVDITHLEAQSLLEQSLSQENHEEFDLLIEITEAGKALLGAS